MFAFLKNIVARSLIIFVIGFGAGILAFRIQPTLVPSPTRSGVHAVFLTNGQVYFGILAQETKRMIRLEKIYYFQLKGLAAAEELGARSDVTLQKLGNEIHGPEDWMEITREQILFIEKLKADGKVAKAIQAYGQKN